MRQKSLAGVDSPELSTEEIIAKLVSETDAVERMEGVILNYFSASMAELVFLAAQKLSGGFGVHLNHKIARDVTTRVLAEIVEHESQWKAELRTARQKARTESRARERARERDREAERKGKYVDL